MTLHDVISTYLNQPRLKDGTRKAYRQALHPMRDYLGPARPLTDITSLDLHRFWSHLTAGDYSPYTVRKHYRSLKAFWNWTVTMRLLTASPFVGIKPPRIPTHNTREKAMTDDEYHQLLEYARYTSPRNYALIIFMADTGCRAISASRLKIADVNLADHSATITGKGDKRRTVFYGAQCAQALRNWIRLKPSGTSEYIFRERVNRRGDDKRPIKPDNISQIIRRTGEAAGIQRSLGAHSLRHRKGHQLADAGVPITVSAKALGHSSTTTTQIYYPDDDARVRQSMEKLATRDGSSPSPKIIPFKRDAGDV